MAGASTGSDEGARIAGWGLQQHLQLFEACHRVQRAISAVGGVVELGTHQGATFIPLIRTKRADEKALAIDPFERGRDEGIHYGAGNEAVLRANLKILCPDMAGIEIWARSSNEITIADLLDHLGHVRTFHIDGERTATSVRHALELADGTLESHGVVLLDDFLNEGWPGVSEGAFDFFRSCDALVPFALIKCKLALCRAAFHEPYFIEAKAALDGMDLDQSKTVALLGRNVVMGR
jgi:hypothetical protein